MGEGGGGESGEQGRRHEIRMRGGEAGADWHAKGERGCGPHGVPSRATVQAPSPPAPPHPLEEVPHPASLGRQAEPRSPPPACWNACTALPPHPPRVWLIAQPTPLG